MSVLVRLFQFVRPYWWLSVIDIVIIVGLTSFRLGPAWFIKLIIDQAVFQHDFHLLTLFLLGLLGSAARTNGLTAIETYIEQWVGQVVIFDLRYVLYRHLQSQSMSFYDRNQTGQLMSRVTNDVSQIQFFVTQGFARLVNIIITVGLNVAILFFIDSELTLVTLLVAPPIYLFQRRQARIMGIFRLVQKRMADLNIVIQENVTGIKLIQAYGREPHEAQRFEEVNRDIRTQRMVTQINFAVVNPGQEFVTMVNTVLILTIGAYRVIQGDLTVGGLVAFH